MTIFTKLAAELNIQGFTPPLNLRDFKLIAFDMDSTLINIECVDERGVHVKGNQLEVAQIQWRGKALNVQFSGELGEDGHSFII